MKLNTRRWSTGVFFACVGFEGVFGVMVGVFKKETVPLEKGAGVRFFSGLPGGKSIGIRNGGEFSCSAVGELRGSKPGIFLRFRRSTSTGGVEGFDRIVGDIPEGKSCTLDCLASIITESYVARIGGISGSVAIRSCALFSSSLIAFNRDRIGPT